MVPQVKHLGLQSKIDTINKQLKAMRDAKGLKQLLNQVRIATKKLFRCERSFILLRNPELIRLYKQEKGFSQAIRIEGDIFEAVIHELMKEEDKFKYFHAEFTSKNFFSGLIKRNFMCWPIIGHTADGEKQLLAMVQIDGYKTFHYNNTDGMILNILL